MNTPRRLILSLLVGHLLTTPPAMADENGSCESALKEKDQLLVTLQNANTQLSHKLVDLETVPAINADTLALKSQQKLCEIAVDVKNQRQSLAEFEAFVTWMTANLSGYSKYIEAGSVAAGFAKMLPIPYAGQASLLTKFISQGLITLNSASVSISRYLATSRDFVAKVDALNHAATSDKAQNAATVARFADERLRKEMNDTRIKLASISELSASTLSFLQSLNHYLGCTDEYWEKTKSFITRSDGGKKEKGFLSQSIQNLQSKAGNFNGRLKNFEKSTEKDDSLIASLRVYNELAGELSARYAVIHPPNPVKP